MFPSPPRKRQAGGASGVAGGSPGRCEPPRHPLASAVAGLFESLTGPGYISCLVHGSAHAWAVDLETLREVLTRPRPPRAPEPTLEKAWHAAGGFTFGHYQPVLHAEVRDPAPDFLQGFLLNSTTTFMVTTPFALHLVVAILNRWAVSRMTQSALLDLFLRLVGTSVPKLKRGESIAQRTANITEATQRLLAAWAILNVCQGCDSFRGDAWRRNVEDEDLPVAFPTAQDALACLYAATVRYVHPLNQGCFFSDSVNPIAVYLLGPRSTQAAVNLCLEVLFEVVDRDFGGLDVLEDDDPELQAEATQRAGECLAALRHWTPPPSSDPGGVNAMAQHLVNIANKVAFRPSLDPAFFVNRGLLLAAVLRAHQALVDHCGTKALSAHGDVFRPIVAFYHDMVKRYKSLDKEGEDEKTKTLYKFVCTGVSRALSPVLCPF